MWVKTGGCGLTCGCVGHCVGRQVDESLLVGNTVNLPVQVGLCGLRRGAVG